jgi:hypothetical protein
MPREFETEVARPIVRSTCTSSGASSIAVRQFDRPVIRFPPTTIATAFSNPLDDKRGPGFSLRTIAMLGAGVEALDRETDIDGLLEPLPFTVPGTVGEGRGEEWVRVFLIGVGVFIFRRSAIVGGANSSSVVGFVALPDCTDPSTCPAVPPSVKPDP